VHVEGRWASVRSADALLADARGRVRRLTPLEAHCAHCDGAHLIDIRNDSQRAEHGSIPGASFISRNVLECRLDPDSPDHDCEVSHPGARVIIVCEDGLQSSLAAATVRLFGVDATDVIDGFAAWRAAGLPVEGGVPVAAPVGARRRDRGAGLANATAPSALA
jgi:rhodanese-related sulfurtransferase